MRFEDIPGVLFLILVGALVFWGLAIKRRRWHHWTLALLLTLAFIVALGWFAIVKGDLNRSARELAYPTTTEDQAIREDAKD